MLRYLRLALELIAGLAGAVIFLGIILIWHLDHSPGAATYLTPPIKSVLDEIVPGLHSDIEHTLLEWNNEDHTLSLHADNIHFDDDKGTSVIIIPSVDLEVSPFGLMLGHFLPTVLKIDHPQIHLVRYSSGAWFLGEQNQNDSSDDIEHILGNILDSLSEAHLTRKLEINRADLDIEDKVRQKHWSMSVPNVTLERRGDELNGLALIEVSPKEGAASLEMLYHHDMFSDEHDMTIRVHHFIPSSLAGGDPSTIGFGQASMLNLPLSGDVTITFNNQMIIEKTALKLHGDAGDLRVSDFWDQPRSVKSFEAKLDFDKNQQPQLSGAVNFDFNGPKLSFTVRGEESHQPQQNLDFDLTIGLEDLALDDFSQLWPKSIIADARSWIVASLSKGRLQQGEVELHGSLAWSDIVNANITDGHGKLSVIGARVDYLPGMPAVEDVDADSDFDLRQMNIQIHSGHAGNLHITPFVAQIMDLDKDTQSISIPLAIHGSVEDVMSVISAPRLSYAQALGLAPQDITGDIDAVVDLRFPLLKDLALADIDVKAHADLENVASNKLGHHIAMTQGKLTLDLDKTGFDAQGPLALNSAPVEINWHQNFSASKDKPIIHAVITGHLNDEQLESMGVDAFKNTRGALAVSLQIDQLTKAFTEIAASVDMGTPEVHLNYINWKKPAGIPANLTFGVTVVQDKPIVIHDINLQSPQVIIKGGALLSDDGAQLLSLDFPSLVVGRTNASVHYGDMKDSDHTLKLDAEGTSLDIAGLMTDQGATNVDNRQRRFSIKVSKLYTSDTGYMTNVAGYAVRDAQGWSEISLHGRAQGESWLDISLKPKDGRRTFSVMCDDFGKALMGMGLTSSVQNGSLKIFGMSTVQNPRIIEGSIKVGSFQVSDLPLLANLMNATTPFGFVDLINKNISFDRIVGKFRWKGDDIELIEMNVPGSSVGINIEGHVDINASKADLHGTLVPFSLVNKILGYIPMIGDLITGGQGQGVLAVAYTITGSLNNPLISVNPISLLTPGFIRNLFFDNDDTDNQKHRNDSAKEH